MITIPLTLLVAHTVLDFSAQTDWQAINKSKRLDALLLHVFIYSVGMAIYAIFIGLDPVGVQWFFALTFLSHLCTDFVTSRISRRLFPFIKAWPSIPDDREYIDLEGRGCRSRHRFFECIGYDQLIHFTTLSFTYRWLVG